MSDPVVYFDACCFIDLAKTVLKIPTIADREKHIYYCRKLIEMARAKEATVYTSMVTVVECVFLDDPRQPSGVIVDDDRVKKLFKGMLLSGTSGVMPVATTPLITEAARDLRWKHAITIKPMDALHVATALRMKATHFVTTDDKLGAANIKRIADMGLIACRADALVSLLPTKYLQIKLEEKIEKPTRGGSLATPPPAL